MMNYKKRDEKTQHEFDEIVAALSRHTTSPYEVMQAQMKMLDALNKLYDFAYNQKEFETTSQ